jgi:hypothetical protein
MHIFLKSWQKRLGGKNVFGECLKTCQRCVAWLVKKLVVMLNDIAKIAIFLELLGMQFDGSVFFGSASSISVLRTP